MKEKFTIKLKPSRCGGAGAERTVMARSHGNARQIAAGDSKHWQFWTKPYYSTCRRVKA